MAKIFFIKARVLGTKQILHDQRVAKSGVSGVLCNPSYWDGGIWAWLED